MFTSILPVNQMQPPYEINRKADQSKMNINELGQFLKQVCEMTFVCLLLFFSNLLIM
jgi:hypothetical protein